MTNELPLQDINVEATTPLIAPADLKKKFPATEKVAQFVFDSRSTVGKILRGEDSRLIAIVGPCSIHSRDIAVEYAEKLAKLSDQVSKQIFVVMRVYFEKPRTTVGWKGLINDPNLNGTFDMEKGLNLARQILLDINSVGLPTATELLEPVTPQYIADLITLGSIGARTTESQTHRQMASGLSMPVGFKNSTEGRLDVAINAMRAAKEPHRFLGINHDGYTCLVTTRGNALGHLILRGGRSGSNYDAESLEKAVAQLNESKLMPRLVVDCSHANSNKDYTLQPAVWDNVLAQRVGGNQSVVGMMLESNLQPGQQKLGDDPDALDYGVSITDGCIGFEQTEQLLLDAAEKLAS